MKNLRHYHAKVLLFGEYVIIQGSSALAIPFKGHSGSFATQKQQYNLDDFFNHLRSLKIEELTFDDELLSNDQTNGFNYISDIPVGYGLGSSGALSAAVFDRYFKKEQKLELERLKEIFAQIESFFHGSSSGLDPLVSYLNSAILINRKKEIELIDAKKDQFQLFLLDTGQSRSTSKLVKIYLEKMKLSAYLEKMNGLCLLNEQAIEAYYKNDPSLISIFHEISKFQLSHFEEMIPKIIRPAYEKYHLKLCGAGGGGYFLGICPKEKFTALNHQGVFIPLL